MPLKDMTKKVCSFVSWSLPRTIGLTVAARAILPCTVGLATVLTKLADAANCAGGCWQLFLLAAKCSITTTLKATDKSMSCLSWLGAIKGHA